MKKVKKKQSIKEIKEQIIKKLEGKKFLFGDLVGCFYALAICSVGLGNLKNIMEEIKGDKKQKCTK